MEGYKNRNETLLSQLNVYKSPAFLFKMIYIIGLQANGVKTS